MKTSLKFVLAGGLLGAVCLLAQLPGDDLEKGFKTPPDSAKPRVWWHWMNGNVTKEGITADLEWMKRVGIGGMQMFDGGLAIPQFTEKRLVWMTSDWKDAFRHAAAEADRLGLEMSMAASGGWSETAGPWVKPQECMKKFVWSETRVEGPRTFSAQLANPPSINGKFQDIPAPPSFEVPEIKGLPGAKQATVTAPTPNAPQPPTQNPTFYADTAVVAFHLPEPETRMADLHPVVTSSAGNIDSASLMDGNFGKPIPLPFPADSKNAWIQFDFPQPLRAQALSLVFGNAEFPFEPSLPQGEFQANQDGNNWVTLVNLQGPVQGPFPARTYSFPETTAKLYRLLLVPPPPNPILAMFGIPSSRNLRIAEINISASPRVNFWEDKVSFGTLLGSEGPATPVVPSNEAIARQVVIDLTSKMRSDGTLDWNVPPGHWVILRMGYSLTGEKNHPATPEATGLEVDKLSRKDVASYLRTYVGMISGALGPYFGKSFRYFLMDSWEAGEENWTEDLISEFRKRRGYDLTPYLPVLTGRIVESAEVSERFLWDFRRTLADLLADNHYANATEYFHTKGVGLYAEAMGTDLPTNGDGLLNKGQVDIPMGEFWTPLPGQNDTPSHDADVHEAASAAHIYGKSIVATESFTSMPFIPAWGQSPFYLKPQADRHLAMGVNRIVFHTSDHQPFVDDAHKPGITLWMFGQHYTRNNTWAEQAVAWNTYLARCSHLLQQGQYVADLAYFYGEGAPATVPFWKDVRPTPPAGYSYDYVNADILLNRMSVAGGRLTLPDGMSYRALVIPNDIDRLTLGMVRKIRDLVQAGAVVIAPRPLHSPSLADYPEGDVEIRNIANEVWGDIDGKSITEHAFGKGKLYSGRTVQEIFDLEKLAPDFEYNRPYIDTELVWIHRHLPDFDVYFVANQKTRTEDVETRFRVDGRAAELWHPDTGAIESAAYKIENGRTTVPLHLDPDGSVFVVFRHPATSPSRTLPRPVSTQLTELEGPWQIMFPPNWGVPPQITLDKLASWTTSADEGVKYFSGTATYTKEVNAPKEWFASGGNLRFDLGTVKEIAELSVNGKPTGGILWKPPFEADVTGVLKPGPNHIEIKITNLWPNRIIGDQQPNVTKQYTWTDYRPYTKDSPLLESGLLGPVTISRVNR
ncbi:MAG TPA: glycosyl hydrolase [Bryobacteraceae bacterium]